MIQVEPIRDSKGVVWYFRIDKQLAYKTLEDAIKDQNGIPRTDVP